MTPERQLTIAAAGPAPKAGSTINSYGQTPQPGDTAVFGRIPERSSDALPAEDQEAISEAMGKPLKLNEYDEDGLAEPEFTDAQGVIHIIYVDPSAVRIFGEGE